MYSASFGDFQLPERVRYSPLSISPPEVPMPVKSTSFRAFLIACCAVTATLALAGSAQAKGSFRTLYSFNGANDGALPAGTLMLDSKGDLYGTTVEGGLHNSGTVFKLARDGNEVVLHSFGGMDGAHPWGDVIADAAGNLYGTTAYGGGGACWFGQGCGVVFKLVADGTETVLHAFDTRKGRYPQGGLVRDSAGNLYGVTAEGGGTGTTCKTTCGTVFKVAPDGTTTTLHVFGVPGQSGDGAVPLAGLIIDQAGNLYGTTSLGGSGSRGIYGGVVFKLTPDGTETILHSFLGGDDGNGPTAPLIADSHGNLYGTTTLGGSCPSDNGCGTVFKIAPDGTETVLYAFQGGKDGFVPRAGLIMDAAGNLFGTTSKGGGTGCVYHEGCGTVFKLAPDGTETVLHTFAGPQSGSTPLGGLVANGKGRLFGTTSLGSDGAGAGTVFKISSH